MGRFNTSWHQLWARRPRRQGKGGNLETSSNAISVPVSLRGHRREVETGNQAEYTMGVDGSAHP